MLETRRPPLRLHLRKKNKKITNATIAQYCVSWNLSKARTVEPFV